MSRHSPLFVITMSRLNASLSLCASALLACTLTATPGWSQSSLDYTGPGHSFPIAIPALDSGDVVDSLVGELLPGPGGLDLALLLADGRLFVNPGFGILGGIQEVASGMVAMTVLRGEGQAQLVCSDGDRLYRLGSDNGQATLTPMDQTGAFMGGATLIPAEVGHRGGSGLIVLNDSRTSADLYHFDGIKWDKLSQFGSSDLSGELIHDALTMEATGEVGRDIQWALLSDSGLKFRELNGDPVLAGGEAMPDFPGSPVDAFLELRPGGNMATGRDLLLRHFKFPGVGEVLELINAEHYELIYVMGLGLQSTGFVDFSGGEHHELWFPKSDAELWIAKNTDTSDITQQTFFVDLEDTSIVSLNLDPVMEFPIAAGAQTFVHGADIDCDGVDELVLVGPRGWVYFLPPLDRQGVTEVPERVELRDIVEPAGGEENMLQLDLLFPLGSDVTTVDFWVFERPDLSSNIVETPIDAGQWDTTTPMPLFADGASSMTSYYVILLEPYSGTQAREKTSYIWNRDPVRSSLIPLSSTPWPVPVDPDEPIVAQAGPGGTRPIPTPRACPFESPPLIGMGN